MNIRNKLFTPFMIGLKMLIILTAGLALIIGSSNDSLTCEGDDCILDDNINGIWTGDGGMIAIVSEYGWKVSIPYQSGDRQLVGRIVARDGIIYESYLSSYDTWGDLATTYSLQSGTASYQGSINATYTSYWYETPFSLVLHYDAGLTERPAALSLLAGSWQYTDGIYTMNLSIDDKGTYHGSDSYGCLYNGSFSVPDAAMNIYHLSLSETGCGVYMPYGDGLALLMDGMTANDTLLFAVRGQVAALAYDSIVKTLRRQ